MLVVVVVIVIAVEVVAVVVIVVVGEYGSRLVMLVLVIVVVVQAAVVVSVLVVVVVIVVVVIVCVVAVVVSVVIEVAAAIGGVNRFYDNLRDMFGFYPNVFWKFCWTISTPAITLGVVLFSASTFTPVKYGSYKFPGWAHAVGGIIGLSSISCIPVYMVYKFLVTEGSYRHRVKVLFRPDAHFAGGQLSMHAPPAYSAIPRTDGAVRL
ncbi:transporter [Elysia marginata]|uniref:Transporter n=1 Tax=Elysia marginata TaxID=1093978 RepID=A0AAV4I1A4_9GAST|nr:transporter [Elysia marginata]